MDRVVVALCGRMRCGKDTAAEPLLRALDFDRAKFAAPLKAACMASFGFCEEQVDGRLKDAPDPELGITPRAAMQWLGTEVFQHGIAALLPDVGREFWARSLVRRIRQLPAPRVVITDLRFPHEAAVLRREFQERCLIVKIARRTGRESNHASETEVDDVREDVLVHNDGTVNELQDRVLVVVRAWLDQLK